MAVSPARKAAFEILLTLERGHAHSDDLLRGKAVSKLSAQDRSLVTALVLGVLRWQMELDERIRPLLKRPNAKLDPEVQIALRLGVFQLRFFDRVPASAAIDESVELTKQSGHRFASAMVNAVLRKLAVQSRETAAPEPAASRAYPPWMLARWQSFYGAEAADAISRHGQSQPTLALRLPDSLAEEELSQSGVRLAPGRLLSRARIVLSGDVPAHNAFREGRVPIQDEGSQLVAEIAGQGSRILDVCAAPGGKTLILAERNPEARIMACEVSPQRLEDLRRRLAPLEDRIDCRLADAAAGIQESDFDLVLADVPCSGTGTLGRNPEIRHRLQLDDLGRQAQRQVAILENALRAARPGGRVIYSTCSLEPEENEHVIAAVMARHPQVRLISLRSRVDEMSAAGILTDQGAAKLHLDVTSEGYLRLLPGTSETDGFFVAMIEKNSNNSDSR